MKSITGKELSTLLTSFKNELGLSINNDSIIVPEEKIIEVCTFLKEDSKSSFDYLNSITAVDYIDRFEIIYHICSTKLKKQTVLRVTLLGREDLSIPSVVNIWNGADYQEREIWDLMGIFFNGHPNMKRLLLWEGFPGHPLRKDFVDTRKS